ncbi:MAG TPA: hypothetical protein VJN68_05640 [Burkholderiaceae bacterium]|nr:hypothetical protein [Burkholderiaceae bacterium]
MSTRFFRAALTTGMSGSSIDPDLAASLQARERHAAPAAGSTRRTTTGFSTLMFGPAPSAGERAPSAWHGLRRVLRRLSAN